MAHADFDDIAAISGRFAFTKSCRSRPRRALAAGARVIGRRDLPDHAVVMAAGSPPPLEAANARPPRGCEMTARRRWGRVRRLESGRWQARYPDGDGRLVSVGTYATKAEAERALAAAEADQRRASGTTPASRRPASTTG